jgi:hypothetical protein
LSEVNKWLSAHAKRILQKCKDTQENGIWVITGTHVAKRSVVGVMSSAQTEFSWSISAEAAGLGKFAPGVNYVNNREDGAWDEHLHVSPVADREVRSPSLLIAWVGQWRRAILQGRSMGSASDLRP